MNNRDYFEHSERLEVKLNRVKGMLIVLESALEQNVDHSSAVSTVSTIEELTTDCLAINKELNVIAASCL